MNYYEFFCTTDKTRDSEYGYGSESQAKDYLKWLNDFEIIDRWESRIITGKQMPLILNEDYVFQIGEVLSEIHSFA